MAHQPADEDDVAVIRFDCLGREVVPQFMSADVLTAFARRAQAFPTIWPTYWPVTGCHLYAASAVCNGTWTPLQRSGRHG
jgi:hypothetical protein